MFQSQENGLLYCCIVMPAWTVSLFFS